MPEESTSSQLIVNKQLALIVGMALVIGMVSFALMQNVLPWQTRTETSGEIALIKQELAQDETAAAREREDIIQKFGQFQLDVTTIRQNQDTTTAADAQAAVNVEREFATVEADLAAIKAKLDEQSEKGRR